MQVNQKVQGNYCGVQFSGVITNMRMLTVKTDGCFEFIVELSKPVHIFGTDRSSLCINAKFDGSPSSYTKFTDELKAA